MRFSRLLLKEVWDGMRNYRFLIMAIGVLFFAVMNPIMNKLIMPTLLRSQIPNITDEVISGMVVGNQVDGIKGYLSDIFQLGTLVISFTLSGLLAGEIHDRTFILPISTGKRYSQLVLSKFLVYGTYLMGITAFGVMVNYYYNGVFFGFDLNFTQVALRAGLLQGVYLLYVLALLLLVGSIIKKPMATGLVTFILAMGTRLVGDLTKTHRFLPSGLVVEGEMLALFPSPIIWQSLASTLALVVLAVGFCLLRMNRLDLSKG